MNERLPKRPINEVDSIGFGVLKSPLSGEMLFFVIFVMNLTNLREELLEFARLYHLILAPSSIL